MEASLAERGSGAIQARLGGASGHGTTQSGKVGVSLGAIEVKVDFSELHSFAEAECLIVDEVRVILRRCASTPLILIFPLSA